MKTFEHTDYSASLEAGTLLLTASNIPNYVQYKSVDGRSLSYLPFLLPDYTLYPAEELLGDTYTLPSFERFSTALSKRIGSDCWDVILQMWTFAYYTGIPSFSSSDVFLMTDGVNYQTPPLFNYIGAFCQPCDYEALRPPVRAFQCYWHFFDQNRASLHEQPPYINQAISHFTNQVFYR